MVNKVSRNTQTLLIPDLVIIRKYAHVIIKPVKVAENKIETNKKISTNGDMGYDIIGYQEN